MQAELRELTRPDPASGAPPVDFKKGAIRVALIVGVVWILCVVIS